MSSESQHLQCLGCITALLMWSSTCSMATDLTRRKVRMPFQYFSFQEMESDMM